MASEEEVSSNQVHRITLKECSFGQGISPYSSSLGKRSTPFETHKVPAKKVCLMYEIHEGNWRDGRPEADYDKLFSSYDNAMPNIQHILLQQLERKLRFKGTRDARNTSMIGAGSFPCLDSVVGVEQIYGPVVAPSTPKQAEASKLNLYPSSSLEVLPNRVLEDIVGRLSVADLCNLSMVNKFCLILFQKDDFWKMMADKEAYSKPRPDESWKFNYMTAKTGFLFARSLDKSPLYFKGDLTIVDPFKLFFTTPSNKLKRGFLEELLRSLKDDAVITYRGIETAFIRCGRDDDTAFEVIRKSKSIVGEDLAKSRFIAAVPQKLVKILMEENKMTEPVGVFVEGVDGEFRSSRDGDFLIHKSAPYSCSGSPVDLDALEEAEVVCASGGSWTFSDDSDDEEDSEHLAVQDEGMSWFEYERRYKMCGSEIC